MRLGTHVYESDSDGGDIQDVPVISPKIALEGLELLRLFRLQNLHVNLQWGEQMEGLLYQEKQDIEGLQDMARHGRIQPQTAITGLFTPSQGIS